MKGKSHSGIIQLIILSLLGGLVLLSLVFPDGASGEHSKKNIEVSVIMREANVEAWSNIRLGMQQAAYDLGGELRFLSPETENSHSSQEQVLMREIQGGTDALIIVPASPEEMANFLQANAPNMQTVSMESSLSPKTVCITPNNEAVGQSLAQLCDENSGTVLLIDSAKDSTGVRMRLNACEKALVKKGIKVEIRQCTTQTLAQDFAGIVQQTGAKTVITFENSATNALASLTAKEKPEITIYGVGASNNIVSSLEKENIKAIVAWSDYAAGYLAMQAVLENKREQMLDKASFNLIFNIVKGDEIYNENNQKLLFPVVA